MQLLGNCVSFLDLLLQASKRTFQIAARALARARLRIGSHSGLLALTHLSLGLAEAFLELSVVLLPVLHARLELCYLLAILGPLIVKVSQLLGQTGSLLLLALPHGVAHDQPHGNEANDQTDSCRQDWGHGFLLALQRLRHGQ